MSRRDLRAVLADAQRRLAKQQMPEQVDARLRRRLLSPSHATRFRASRAVVLAGSVAAVVAAVVIVKLISAGPRQLGGLELVRQSTDLRARVTENGAVELLSGSCTLIDTAAGETLSLTAPGRIRKEQTGVRVLAGTVEVAVAKRTRRSMPARVLVSHGVIEVLGTSFTVLQQPEGGSVTLHEGKIRFESLTGEVSIIVTGESLVWPYRAAQGTALPVDGPGQARPADPPLPASASARPAELPSGASASARPAAEPAQAPDDLGSRAKHRATPPNFSDTDAQDLLHQIEVLRSRRRYAEAVRSLRLGLQKELRPAARERLSYELGSILTYQLGQRKEACHHWEWHSAQYPTGLYDLEIRQAEEFAQCTQTERQTRE